MKHLLLTNASLVFVFMTAAWLVARKRKRLDAVDVAWGLGFIIVAWSSLLSHPTYHSQLIANMVTIWGARLAVHIYRRQRGKPNDPRYDELSSKWKGNFWARAYVSIFLLQGALVLLVSLPIVVATGSPIHSLAWLSTAGTIMWSVGFVIEAVADNQLSAFIKQPKRPKVLQTGLWRYSRHPNYFGELVQWWAIALIALQVENGWVGLIGPLVLSVLIIFVSGIPPIEKRRAKDPEYRDYQRRTSPLVPLPPRR